MNMKWSDFKLAFAILSLSFVLYSQPIGAQTGYEKRVEKYHTFWNKLIPTHAKLQYAGSMGLLSLGAGWDYGKNNQWETDVYLGYLPKYSTKRAKATFTVKQNFIPWKTRLNNTFALEPFACGLYVNTILDGDFWVNEPDKYPDSYYAFSTKVRFNIYIGQRLIYNIKSSKRILSRSVTFFYEISTNDLYLVSAIPNRYLKPSDYLHLSLGLKMQID